MTHSQNWTPTGTRISGTGYGACLYRNTTDPSLYAAGLSHGGSHVIVPMPHDPEDGNTSYSRAYRLMDAFCHTFGQWGIVQGRTAWLSKSPNHAVIGGLPNGIPNLRIERI